MNGGTYKGHRGTTGTKATATASQPDGPQTSPGRLELEFYFSPVCPTTYTAGVKGRGSMPFQSEYNGSNEDSQFFNPSHYPLVHYAS